MLHTLDNGTTVNIPDREIDRLVESLEISISDAVALWLDDNSIEIDEETEKLNNKLKTQRINYGVAPNVDEKTNLKRTKPHNYVASNEKQRLCKNIIENLPLCEGVDPESIEILIKDRWIKVNIGKKEFKINIVETKKKNVGKKLNKNATIDQDS